MVSSTRAASRSKSDQASEAGTVYSADEVHDIAEITHAYSPVLTYDGARFANAVVSLAVLLRYYLAGLVSMTTFGATKNGAGS